MARKLPLFLLAVPLFAAVAACGRSAEFRHAAHVTVTKGECAPCHGPDPAAPRPATDADCAACHRQAQEASAAGAARYGVGKGPAASMPRRVRGGAQFPHAPHAAAGIPCVECHAATKWRGNMFVLPTAEECSACHSRTSQRGVRHPGEDAA